MQVVSALPSLHWFVDMASLPSFVFGPLHLRSLCGSEASANPSLKSFKFGDVGDVQWCLPAWRAWSIVREEVRRAHWGMIHCDCRTSCFVLHVYADLRSTLS